MDRFRHNLVALLLCAASLAVSAPLQAQSSGRNACNLTFRVNVFSARGQLPPEASPRDSGSGLPVFYYRTGGEYHEVETTPGRLTGSLPYQGAPALTFYLRQENADGAPLYRPAFHVELGSDWQDALVLLIPPGSAQERFKAFAINNSPSNLKPGEILVYNLTAEDLVMNANDRILPLAPFTPSKINIDSISNNTLSVALALKDRDAYELVYQRKWKMRPTLRGIYFLYTLDGDNRRWFMKNIIL